ncbi:uncharacterized protein LOC125956140 isoform X1 [Anopheles darlingi]|uniref:uncharacterized protein LOC125956140 isoform X1 n=1 Tax=Anopheles darlingi TaxID=43151 RepID=UPI0021001536|nr:uncharacterized protein LOC125956140 isoform X1 [Anopheles darlingi]
MVEDGSWPAKDNNNGAAVREKEMEKDHHGLHQAFAGGGIPQHQQNESPDQHQEEEEMEEEEEEAGITSEHSVHGEKRKFSEIDSESDEDGFAGFEEDAVSDNLGSPSTTSDAFRTALKSQNNRTVENNKSEEEVGGPVETASVDDHPEIKQEYMDVASGAVAGGQDATKLAATAVAAAAAKKKVNVPVNTQDVIYKLPFKYGWKRELVYRANMEGNSKDKGEVYYITPQGRKLRTRNDIVSALHDDLTMDNFTFVKEPVGGNPEEETIRSAKSYGNPPKRSVSGTPTATILDSSADLGKRVPKPKMPKGASPTPPSPYSKAGRLSPKSNASSGVGAGGGGTGVLTVSSRNNVFSGSTKGNENINNQDRAKPVGKNRLDTCTIQCLPAMGMIPQLQCIVCYAMYHPECVTATTAEALARRFTCKSCVDDAVAAEAQLAQNYKESFGMHDTSNGNAPVAAAAASTANTVAKNSKSSSSNKTIATDGGHNASSNLVHKEKSKQKDKALTPQHPQSSSKHPKSQPSGGAKNSETDKPPQEILVIGGNEYVVVPKGKETSAKSKKASKSTNLPQQQPTIAKSVDESRKMASNAVSGPNNKHLGTNDRLSGEGVLPAVGGGIGGTGSHVGSSRNHHITASNGSARDPSNFLSEVSAGYQALMQIFDYLKVQELLRASSVCRMWNHVGNHQRFWRTVRMKNSYVKDWGGMIAKLRKNGTKHLDLRKVLNAGSNDEMWRSFIEHIGQAPEIETIDLCRCSSSVVGKLLRSNPNLRVVNALAIKNDPIDFINFEHGKNLEELRLKSSAPISVDGDLRQLGALRNLKHLSLTSIAKLGATSIDALGSLVLLESLELGECTEIGANLAEILPKLSFLKRLRLEKGQDNFDMFTVLDGIAKVATLQQLELINCDIKLGFDKHIVSCRNLTKLLLIPTYVSQSAATNQMILKGLLKLHATLQLVVWVITEELLRVTELYIGTNVDDSGVPNKLGETIPILKPVPGSDEPSSVTYQTDVPDKVEIVPLTKLESILERRVPNTKVLILKIPFTNTWKQTMVDHL